MPLLEGEKKQNVESNDRHRVKAPSNKEKDKLETIVMEMKLQMKQMGKQVNMLYSDQIFSVASSPKSS